MRRQGRLSPSQRLPGASPGGHSSMLRTPRVIRSLTEEP